MLTVSLSGLKFHAPIGLFAQEKIVKNEIEVNVSLSRPSAISGKDLLDYGILHQILREEILKQEDLLESVLKRIVNRLEARFPGCRLVLSLRKWYPPLVGRMDYAEVKWETPT